MVSLKNSLSPFKGPPCSLQKNLQSSLTLSKPFEISQSFWSSFEFKKKNIYRDPATSTTGPSTSPTPGRSLHTTGGELLKEEGAGDVEVVFQMLRGHQIHS